MITTIFGAGASFGSGRCLPRNPPLGKDLFAELLKLNGAFASLENRQKTVFIEEGFEAGMATVANINLEINPLQKELACYISNFLAPPDNAYTRLINKIQSVSGKMVIATLNYDLLIEQSLAHHNIAFNYNGRKGSLSLIKVHGSCNFLPDLGSLSMMNNIVIGGGSFVEGLPTNIASSSAEIKSWCSEQRNVDISPVFAMYARDKRVVVNKSIVEAAQKNYRNAIMESSHIVVVGTNFIQHDEHIWAPVAERNVETLIVDPHPGGALKWARGAGLRAVKHMKIGFQEGVLDIAKYIRAAAYSS